MIWIVAIIAIIVVFSLAAGLIGSDKAVARSQARLERENRIVSRVAAYRDYIRREGDEALQRLSDNELEDLIANAMRGIANDIDDIRSLTKFAFWASGALVTVALFAAPGAIEPIWQYVPKSYPVFMVLWVLTVLGTAYAISRLVSSWRARVTARKWEARGWDVSRLIV